MSWYEKLKQRRRRARAARLRREITDLSSLIQRLSPNYDHELITKTHATLVAKRQELANLTNRKDS